VAIAHEATYPSRASEYGPALGSVLEAAGKVSAAELGKAHIVRDRFTGQAAAAFQDIDVLLIPVWPTPMPTAAEWMEMAQRDIADLLRYAGVAKVGLDEQFIIRYRDDDSVIGSFRSLWIVTEDGGRWAVAARSSFAG
jgi:hypothetical protein